MNASDLSVDSLALSRKSELGGIGYSRDTIQQLHGAICAWLRGSRLATAMVGYVNPHVFNLAKRNERLREFLAKADVVAVDGLGFALGVLLLKRQTQTRTVMTPLFDWVLVTNDLPDLKAVLIGSTAEIAARAAAAMNRVAKSIHVVEVCDGYRPIEDYLCFLEQHAEADLVLAAMGSPRSEEFLLAARACIKPKLLWNIGGGTLHFYAGTQPRVPKFVSAAGIQWLWRIVHQPGIAPRYILGIPLYLGYLASLALSQRITNPK